MEISTITQAMQLHAQLIKTGHGKNTLSLSKLFNFTALSYSGNLSYARAIFDSIPCPNSYFWNTMIRAYSKSTEPEHALQLFLTMQHKDHKPDKFTYPFILKSCGCLRKTHEGKQFHALIYKSGLEFDRFIQNSLIHMYCDCGESNAAARVFEKMLEKDVVSWTSIIDGYVDDNRSTEALQLFGKMEKEGIEPNDATVVSVLRACADVGALDTGRKIHQIVEEKNFGKVNVSTALIDMYSKCGCIDSARKVFEKIEQKDVFAWTTMISGLASHGKSKEAIDLFETMVEMHVKPDVRTITAVLSACKNAGWVREGYSYLNKMEKRFGLRPTIQHYGCMVDLLARAGYLKEAEQLIKRMPIEADSVVWRNLIWACKVHGDKDRSDRLMNQHQHLQMDFKIKDSGTCVLFGNIYASTGEWSEKAKVRQLMNKKGLTKPKGSSKIETKGTIHEFVAGATSHPDAKKIYEKLDEITEDLILAGYQPKVSEVMLDIEDEEKALQLHHHSERIAVAFALISTNKDARIQIVKNLRSCEDCHNVMKLISKVYEREIVIRDRIRFHHFKNGNCSCGDYW
ncbi:Pentatricopeptide repeat-containing protein [Thalictrum thalictroides]|uniref:Pentatricopeptide repeat-containing protein n=1 Tax=Thalictrum thalictroides TaxID=46969 RepID=A0A7J6VH00_THATH|nr:Pentatricopeptide repeat-containing protein [Thalictrum thalictroides]